MQIFGSVALSKCPKEPPPVPPMEVRKKQKTMQITLLLIFSVLFAAGITIGIQMSKQSSMDIRSRASEPSPFIKPSPFRIVVPTP
jgi:hypothetical protein